MEYQKVVPVFKAWAYSYCNKALDSFSDKSNLTDILFKRIWIISGPVIRKYTEQYIEAKNPFFALSEDLVPQEDIDTYITEVKSLLAGKDIDYFNDEYPLLSKRIKEQTTAFIDFVNEMIQRINLNKKDISKYLLSGKEFSEILGFCADGADVHNNGKFTTVVETDAGKFVFKPHDCKTDLLFKKICSTYFNTSIKVPDILYVNEDYSFEQFITNNPADTEEKASFYYENLGALCSLLTFLNGTDYHEENLLADGCCPVPIDLETVIMGVHPDTNDDVQMSAFSTSMFSLQSSNVQERETSALFDLSDYNVSCPVVNGKRESAVKYRSSFKRGFEKNYRYCLSNKDKLLKMLSEDPSLKIRILLRNTNYYAVFSDEVNSWKSLRGDISDSMLIEKLSSGMPGKVAAKEFSFMKKGDIPYFYVKPFSKSVFSLEGEVCENYFALTPFEYLKECLSKRNPDELEFELRVIDFLFDNAITNENKPRVITYKEEDPVKRAEELFKNIKDSFFVSPSGELIIIEVRNEQYAGARGIDLATGKTGIALFFAALYSASNNPEIKRESLELCNRLLRDVKNRIDVLFANELYKSVFIDDFGIKKALNLIGKYTGITFANDSVFKTLDHLNERKIINSLKSDSDTVYKDTLLSGNSAIADCLIEEYKKTKNTELLEKARQILLKPVYNYLPEHCPALFCSGLGDGASGIGYELIRLAKPELIDSVFN